jgi:hypothetical protein
MSISIKRNGVGIGTTKRMFSRILYNSVSLMMKKSSARADFYFELKSGEFKKKQNDILRNGDSFFLKMKRKFVFLLSLFLVYLTFVLSMRSKCNSHSLCALIFFSFPPCTFGCSATLVYRREEDLPFYLFFFEPFVSVCVVFVVVAVKTQFAVIRLASSSR